MNHLLPDNLRLRRIISATKEKNDALKTELDKQTREAEKARRKAQKYHLKFYEARAELEAAENQITRLLKERKK